MTMGAAFAAVPLYSMFCQVTGYDGTTQRADKAVGRDVVDRDHPSASTPTSTPGMPWKFEPSRRSMKVKIGENALAFYKVTNTSDQPITGTATYNVSPDVAGALLQQDASASASRSRRSRRARPWRCR